MRKISFTAENDETVLKLLLSNNVSKRLIKKLKQTKSGITKDGSHIRTVDKIYKGDCVTIMLEDEKTLEANGSLRVPVLFECEDLIAFDKPYNMPVHPSIKHQGDTLGNYFSYLCKGLAFRPVNRLDRDTSGVCIVAKNAYSAKSLQQSLEKTYYAIVCGRLEDEGTIDLPIGRVDGSIITREVSPNGQRAVTHYKALKYSDDEKYTLMEIKLETGRTHQIRVHFSYIGFPLAGDEMYGGDYSDIKRQALHCKTVRFVHPITGEQITIDSELPDDMKRLID